MAASEQWINHKKHSQTRIFVTILPGTWNSENTFKRQENNYYFHKKIYLIVKIREKFS